MIQSALVQEWPEIIVNLQVAGFTFMFFLPLHQHELDE